MTNLAIIPARGGSKRIPRKNIKDFLGKPILAYSIETALKSKIFDEVMVSTDDEEIAEVAIKYGAKVPFMRTIDNSNDFATTTSVVKEVIDKYLTDFKMSFNLACCIYPTAPLVKQDRLNEGYELIIKNKFSKVFPVVKFGYPIWRGVKIDLEQKASMIWPENIHVRSQDLAEVFHDAGQWYWFKPDEIDISLISGNAGVIILNELEVQDIDSMSDWELAELKYKVQHGI